MRLIDADALIEKSAEEYIVAGGNGEMAVPVEAIQNAPTVDAVSKELFDRIKWERNIAIEALKAETQGEE